MPVVMLAVNISDWGSRKLFWSDIFQTPQIDTENLTDLRDVAYAERAHAAVFAKIMLIPHRIEQIFS